MMKPCLSAVLLSIVLHDTDYAKRSKLIYEAIYLACALGYDVGFRIDPQEPDWPVAFIELPTGQVSWHLAQHSIPWDGHSTEEKFKRIEAFVTQP